MDDLISRQEALDELRVCYDTKTVELDNGDEYINYEQAWDLIEHLPSAQPDVIRCKDCKHSAHWYGDKDRCYLWAEGGIDVFKDGFCNYAERRTDE